MSSPRRRSARSSGGGGGERSSARTSGGGGGGERSSAKRQRIAQLQELIAAERAAVQGAHSRNKELNDARRILEATRQCARLSALFSSVRQLPDGEGERLVSEHASADREQKARLAQLEQQLAAALEHQNRQQERLEQLRRQIPPASEARQRMGRAHNDPAVHRAYTAMLQNYGDVSHMYNMLEKLMVCADYPWLESTDWMQRIRPAYHALPPPSHVLRADLRAADGGSDGGGSGSGSGSGESSPP